ncbi:MAG: FKBP-type peptidyl-prolyl cis-trans isomerase [Candidatus Latescibacteria bacterium]|nr:FKBP-type peptidyl-prolyl cis-trans isomerase [Candidatus Latescibacterota bacterium]
MPTHAQAAWSGALLLILLAACSSNSPTDPFANCNAGKLTAQAQPGLTVGDTLFTRSNLGVILLKAGGGCAPRQGDLVEVHYTGTLLNGEKFDSSRDRNEPFSFALGTGRVIAGWDEGIALLQVGDQARLIVPPQLGYGSRDLGVIPPNSTLIFDVELLRIR